MITSLDIPTSLNEIGSYAFYTTYLKDINWLTYLSTFSDNDFDLGNNGNYFYLKSDENTNAIYPEVNGIKFIDLEGNKGAFAEGDPKYYINYDKGEIKETDENGKTVGYFSLPYYIFSAKLNNKQQYSLFKENSGKCGNNLEYFLKECFLEEEEKTYYTLTITGEGEMYNFTENISAPWTSVASQIKNIELTNKLTSIGSYAFIDCEELEVINCPTNLKKIGNLLRKI